jgi:hypothetical protein
MYLYTNFVQFSITSGGHISAKAMSVDVFPMFILLLLERGTKVTVYTLLLIHVY